MKVECVVETVGKYTLLKTDGKYQPWVVAWGYNPTSKSWGQGHYFCEFRSAFLFYESKVLGID